MGLIYRLEHHPQHSPNETIDGQDEKLAKYPSPENPARTHFLPVHMHEGKLKTKYIVHDGESGRAGFHPFHFLHVIWMSSNTLSRYVNILWPVVPIAIALHFARPEWHVAIFTTNYIAMVPAANMLGFAGQEFARKLPKVFGILIETTLGSLVEIILFIILVTRAQYDYSYVNVLQAAILGSIMTNLLLCLGTCFFVGGLKNPPEQTFHAVISETGSGILFVAAFGLLIPSAFYAALEGTTTAAGGTPTATTSHGDPFTLESLINDVKYISRGLSVILIVAFAVYIVYCSSSAHSVFDDVLKADEEKDGDRERDLAKKKLTMFECIVAILFSIAMISLIAVFLVEQIHFIVEDRHVPDAFLGFILVPLVEKLAEHLTAVDEAYDNQINFALYHCIGPSIQTAMFNAPLAVIVSWGLETPQKFYVDLNFEIFMIVILVLTILAVGNFLRDGASTWLEGFLLIVMYIIIALTTYYYPNPAQSTTNGESGGQVGAKRWTV